MTITAAEVREAERFAAEQRRGLADRPNANIVHDSNGQKDAENPQNHGHDHHNVEDVFDLGVHGNVAVDQPKQHADDDQDDDKADERHSVPPFGQGETLSRTGMFHG